jgi:UDP-N-acetylmuramyl tripeptide synthase
VTACSPSAGRVSPWTWPARPGVRIQRRHGGSGGGRYARYRVGGHDTQLVLAKNPSSWLEALDLIDGDGRTVVLVVNAGTPDGTDPNRLWDVPFEQLRGRKVYVSGERSADLAVRLRYADVTCTVEPDALAALMAAGRECVVIANYSAFVSLRLQLRMSA